MNKTKKKIILSAIKLFNEQGLNNVRNQDIAEHAAISLSNFNYHFSTKKDLVLDVVAYMSDVLKKKVYGEHIMTSYGSQAYEIAKAYFLFEQEFKFFYLDTHNIIQTYPEIQEGLRKQINDSLQLIMNFNFIAIGKGYMKPIPAEFPNLYEHLAQQIWMNNHFYMAQLNIRGLDHDMVSEGIRSIFYICYPYMTELGITKFEEYIQKL